MSRNGKPVPIRANSGSSIVDTCETLIAEPGAASSAVAVVIVSGYVRALRLPDQPAIHARGDRHSIAGKSMQEVGGPIQRVNDPHQIHRSPARAPAPRPRPAIRGSAASRTSEMMRSAVRSTSVTKSRAPLRVQSAGSAGRWTLPQIAARASGRGPWPDAVSLRRTKSCVPSSRRVSCRHATHILRYSAVRRAAYRQLARGGAELGQPATQLRVADLHRGPARHHR